MIEVSPGILLSLIGILLTAFGLFGRATWKLAKTLSDAVGELKLIRVLMQKGEEEFVKVGRDIKDLQHTSNDHETRITVIESK